MGNNGLTTNTTMANMQTAMLMQAALEQALTDTQTSETGWISETELASGQIPATLSSDSDLGSKNPLNGSVSYNVDATHAITMKKGSLVFAPTVDSTIKTPYGTVKVDAGSLVLILSFSNGLAVYDLDDSHHNAVSVLTPGQEFKLFPGMNLVVTSNEVKSFEQINPAQLFAYRNITAHELAGGMKAFSTEFFVPSAIQAVLPLKQLLSSNQANAKRLIDHLLKTTAATMQVKSNGAQFQQKPRPVATACAE